MENSVENTRFADLNARKSSIFRVLLVENPVEEVENPCTELLIFTELCKRRVCIKFRGCMKTDEFSEASFKVS